MADINKGIKCNSTPLNYLKEHNLKFACPFMGSYILRKLYIKFAIIPKIAFIALKYYLNCY